MLCFRAQSPSQSSCNVLVREAGVTYKVPWVSIKKTQLKKNHYATHAYSTRVFLDDVYLCHTEFTTG